MRLKTIVPSSIVLICAVGIFPARAEEATARVFPLLRQSNTNEGHQGHEAVTQEARLENGRITYALRYASCWHESHGPGGAAGDTYLGMPLPSAANWYHGGFLRLRLNGQDLGLSRLRDMWAAEQGPRAAIKLAFDHPVAHVLITALLLANDDWLFLIITLQPKPTETIGSLDLSLLCYPSFFTYWHKRQGDRKALTATQTYSQADGVKQRLKPSEQPWIAFYDTIFDPARGEGDGGCALAFLPEQISAAELVVGSYACALEMQIQPAVRQLRLCLWDFNKQGNEAALARLKAIIPQTLEQLRMLDPLPLALQGYDVSQRLTAALALLAGVPGATPLQEKLQREARALTEIQEALQKNEAADPAQAEKAFAQGLAAFEELLWEARFFALIHGP